MDISQKIEELFYYIYNLDFENDPEALKIAIITMVATVVGTILLGILIFKLIKKGEEKTGYKIISPNIIFTAIPFFLVLFPSFIDSEPFPEKVVIVSTVICWNIPIIVNIICCRGHIGYIIFYTLIQLFLGLLLCAAGIAVIAVVVLWVILSGAFVYQKAETYNISLAPVKDGYFVSTDKIIRAKRNENNPDQLDGENGEIFSSMGNGNYMLISSFDSSEDLFEIYTIY